MNASEALFDSLGKQVIPIRDRGFSSLHQVKNFFQISSKLFLKFETLKISTEQIYHFELL